MLPLPSRYSPWCWRYVEKLPWINTRSTGTRRAEVALDLMTRPFSSIELACAVRRACVLCANLLCFCFPRTWPARDHVGTQHQVNIFFTLHTALFTPCTSRFTLALHTPQFISSQIIWFLRTSCRLIWPLLISSNPFSLLTCHLSKFFSTVFISSEHWNKIISTQPSPSARQKALTAGAKPFAKETLSAQSFCTQKLENTLYYKACAKRFPVLLCTTKLAQSTSQYYFVLQSLHKVLPKTTLYYELAQSASQYYFVPQSLHKVLPSTALCDKTGTKCVPALLCTTKKLHKYCFVLQSLHKVRPSTTLYHRSCLKYFPTLLCTTKLAQSTSQHYFVLQSLHKERLSNYFVLQSLHKARPSTTLYHEACLKHFPTLLCTTKLAQSTSQYYFVLQSLHKVRPSTTMYYKACTKHFPELLCTTKLAQSASQNYFVLRSLHKQRLSTTKLADKVRPSTTMYYKACTKCFPELLRTTKLAQTTSQ